MKTKQTVVYCVLGDNRMNFFTSSSKAQEFADTEGQHIIFKVDRLTETAPVALRHALTAAVCFPDFGRGSIGHA